MTEERLTQLYDEYFEAQSQWPPDYQHMRELAPVIRDAEAQLPRAS